MHMWDKEGGEEDDIHRNPIDANIQHLDYIEYNL